MAESSFTTLRHPQPSCPIEDQLALMQSLRAQIRVSLQNSEADDITVDENIREHAGRLRWVLDQMAHVVDKPLLSQLQQAQFEMTELCNLVSLQLRLVGNDMRRAYELRRSLTAYGDQSGGVPARNETGLLG